MGRLQRAIAVLALVGLSAIGFVGVSTGTASAAVVLADERSLTLGSTVSGGDTGFVYSGSGPVTTFGATDIHTRFPPGALFPHADTRPGVPASPITNRPTEGDVVGDSTLTSAFNYASCSGPLSRYYRFVWHEQTWNGATDPRKVAELGLEFESSPGSWIDFSPIGIHYDILLISDGSGLPEYEAIVPVTRTDGLFCDGAFFRQTAHFSAPFGKTLMRNPEQSGTYQYCTDWLTSTLERLQHCAAITIDAIDGTSAGLTTPAVCTITGTEGPDILRGTIGDDVICALGGDDLIKGGDGNDVVIAGDGNDRIIGSSGDDSLDGGSGSDTVISGAGNDVIFGGSEDDVLNGGTGDDYINAGSGDDRATGGSGSDVLGGGFGEDRLILGSGDDQAVGGSGADTIAGGAGNDSISGGDGLDVLAGSAGSDLVYGGPDFDTCKIEPIVDLGILTDC